MKTYGRNIPLELAEPGMKLASNICNQQGQVLVETGVELSEALLRALLKRGIGHVTVLYEDKRSEDELAAERAKVLDRLNTLFRNAGQDEMLDSLYQQVLEYRLEILA